MEWALSVCVCMCVCPGGWEETRPLLPLHGVGEGQLGWGPAGTVMALPTLAGQVTLGEPGTWLPACRVPADGFCLCCAGLAGESGWPEERQHLGAVVYVCLFGGGSLRVCCLKVKTF